MLVDPYVADAARLDLRCPFGPVLKLGTDFHQTESDTPSLKSVLSENLAERFVLSPLHDLAVEAIEVRQDQPPGDQRIDDPALGRRCPVMQFEQRRQVKALNVVTDQHVGPRQVLERFVDLPGPIFIHTIAIDSADDDAMNFGDALEQAVSFKVKYQAQLLEVLVSRRNDEGLCEPLEHPARIGMRF